MQVVLLYPEVYDMARFAERRKEFPPFGVLYLAAAAEAAGHSVQVRAVTPGQPAMDLSGFDVVGFSLASSATYGVMLEARRRALVCADALVLVGGVHANFYPQQSLADFRADVVFQGESEESLPEVLDRATGGSRDFTGITGTWWTDAQGLHREAPRPSVADIDRLALPARHLLPLDDVVIPDRLAGRDLPMAHVMLSRGCPFPCAFCAAGHTRARYRGGPSARAELQHLAQDYGIKGFAIVDDNFVVNRRKVADICEHIADLDLTWSALSRVDTVNEHLLDAMAAAGCIEIKYGVESGSESLLKAMRKNTTRAQIKKAFAMTADEGIEAKAFIIHGFPGEDEGTTEETISLLTELGSSLSRVSLFRFVPLPGSGVYADPEGHDLHGLHTQDDWDGDWSKFHIHHNPRHWWGTHEQWQRTEAAYQRLHDVVEARWNPQG